VQPNQPMKPTQKAFASRQAHYGTRSECLPRNPVVAYLCLVDMAVDLSMGKSSPVAVFVIAVTGVGGSGFEAAEVSRGELVFPAVG
jgi:hypothetical protein